MPGSHDGGSSRPGTSWARPLSTAVVDATGSAFQASMLSPCSATEVVMMKSTGVEVTQLVLMPCGPIRLAIAVLMLLSVDVGVDARPK